MIIKTMTAQQRLQFVLGIDAPPARAVLLERWRLLMDEVLRNMPKLHHWPISLNHCFMRVCLDTSLRGPWHTIVKRPASRHMKDHQLRQAIAVSEQIAESPHLLFELNHRSIKQRKLFRFNTASA